MNWDGSLKELWLRVNCGALHQQYEESCQMVEIRSIPNVASRYTDTIVVVESQSLLFLIANPEMLIP